MMKGNDTVRNKRQRILYLLVMLFFILATAILVTSYVYYQNYERNYKLEIDHQLSAISDLKVNELVGWRTERLGDAGTFFHNPLFSSRVSHFLNDTNDTETEGELRTWLEKEMAYSQYDRVYLTDTAGTILMSVPDTSEPISAAVKRELPGILASGNISLLDFYKDDSDQKIHLTIVVPVYDDQQWGSPLGFLAFQIDPEIYLYPFIREWPGPSPSAETLIVRREGNEAVYLNNIRFINNSALNLRIPLDRTEVPAVKAVLGEEGIVQGNDYRGISTIAAIREVPGTPWFLVARMDSSEVYGPLREQFLLLIGIVALLLLGIGAGIGIIWKGESTRFYRQMYETEKELHEERQKASSYLEIVGMTILAVGADQNVTMINPAGCRLLVRSEEEILGKNWFDTFLPERVREESRSRFIRMGSGESGLPDTIENLIVTSTGEERLISWHIAMIHDENQAFSGIIQSGEDITERKRMEDQLEQRNKEMKAANEDLVATEEELKSQYDELSAVQKELWKSEERFRLTLDATNDGIWDWDIPTGTAFFSPHWYTMLGYEPGEMPGSYATWRSLVYPDDLPVTEEKIQDAIRNNAGYNIEFRMRTKQGDWKWILTRGSVVEHDETGNPVRMVGTHTDITERRRIEDTLVRVNQKLNVLSQLTRKDLTNQIFILNGYLELAKKQAAGLPAILESIKKGEQASSLINEITEFTRDYQDMGIKPPVWQNVKLAFLFGLSHISIGECNHSIETGPLEIFADPMLEKACQGLFENSLRHGGHVTQIRIWHTITPDGATIFYEDNGIGIPHESKEKVFLRGDGLHSTVRGLFFIREILDITNLTIRETGEPGKGARFEIHVPNGEFR
jgi:PAS domain S-box-containing protein